MRDREKERERQMICVRDGEKERERQVICEREREIEEGRNTAFVCARVCL